MQESPLPPWNRHHSPLYVSAIFTFRSQSRPRDKKSRARSRRSQNRALSVPPAFIRCPQCHSDSPPSLCEPGAPAPGYSPSPTRCCRASWWHRHLSLSSVAIRLHLSLFCSEHTSRTSKPKLELPRPHWSCTSSELSFPRARTYAASLKDPIRPRAARLGWRTALGQDACLGHDPKAVPLAARTIQVRSSHFCSPGGMAQRSSRSRRCGDGASKYSSAHVQTCSLPVSLENFQTVLYISVSAHRLVCPFPRTLSASSCPRSSSRPCDLSRPCDQSRLVEQ
jgi:hypothetical protein